MIFPENSRGFRSTGKPILWVSDQKEIPPRPDNPESFPKEDPRHWYDKEFAGWNIVKINIPKSPGDGPNGKKITCLLPGRHPYNTAYRNGMEETAAAFGMEVVFKYADWDDEEQLRQVDETILEKPDLIILVPENSETGTLMYKKINKSGVPVIASNLMPDEEGFRYILTWTGPDDWGQFRKLAAVFAQEMTKNNLESASGVTGGNPGYCIITHIPGCSAYYARTWGIITELKKIAPSLELLDTAFTSLDTEKTYRKVSEWLEKYGSRIKGIISADDNPAQIGINKALSEHDREDIVRVANGSSRVGIRMLKEGKINAITFQSAELDGALPVQVAVDWFNGLEIPPLKYLPIHILTKENVSEFVFNFNNPEEIDLNPLFKLIIEGNTQGVAGFYTGIYNMFTASGVLSVEFFKGFSIEILSNLLNIIRNNKLDEKKIIGSYEAVFKNLFRQPTIEQTFDWLKDVSLEIVSEIKNKREKPLTLIQQVVEYVDNNFNEPISLKVLSNKFNVTPSYLGKMFKEETGMGFSRYLNTKRIEKAKELLATSPEKANKIAIEVGYSDSNYFYSIFKKYTGLPPSEYIKKLS